MRNAERQRVLDCYQRHKDMIYKLAWVYCKDKFQAEDVFQEVFYRFLRYHPKFQSNEHEKAWFIRTTINVCKNVLKSKWNHDMVQLEEWDGSQACTSEQGDHFDDLRESILRLSPKYRIPIHLYYYEEYSVSEIAKILHRCESTVQTQLQRGREQIKQALERSGLDDIRP